MQSEYEESPVLCWKEIEEGFSNYRSREGMIYRPSDVDGTTVQKIGMHRSVAMCELYRSVVVQ